MALIVTTDMKYTRPGEEDESNVLSAHNPLIWEFNDDAIAGVATATVQIIVKDNAASVIYTSDIFPAYLTSKVGNTAYFRFDASEIMRHIISHFFYREMSEDFISPENYGSEIEVNIKSYEDGEFQDIEIPEYFSCHAINQICDEYGSNIARMFYNDMEDIAHFLGYPNKLFFYSPDDISAYSTLLEIIDKTITEVDNLISSWTNLIYDVFTSTGTAITSAVSVGGGGAKSNSFTVVNGKTYLVTIPAFVLNSGEYPKFRFMTADLVHNLSNILRIYQAGDNILILFKTSYQSSATTAILLVDNDLNANWSCGSIRVRPVESAIIGTALQFLHCADLHKCLLSKNTILAKAYTDLENMTLLKTFNIHIFEGCPDGFYIRYLNRDGIYAFWLFSPYPYRNTEVNQIGKVINSFSEMAVANSRNRNIGYKDSYEKLDVISDSVPILFRRKLMDLFISPAVYLWKGLQTENENLISGLINGVYDTFIKDGTVILSAIESGTYGIAYGTPELTYSLEKGETVNIIFNLNLNSGQAPFIGFYDSNNNLISDLIQTSNGINLLTNTFTKSGLVKFFIYNNSASNFSTSRIIVKRGEKESDWIQLERVEGSHLLREKKEHDNFECTLVLPEKYTQKLGGSLL